MAFHIGQRTIECAVRASPVAYVAEVIGGAGRQTFCKRNVHDRADFLVGTISDLARNLSFEPIRRIFRNRSEEHTSELQSLMRISYAVFCLKKKKIQLLII